MAGNRFNALFGKTGVVVCDGAMGTMLYERGVFVNRSFDELNLTKPDLVLEVHKEYMKAGSDLIETNTFSANRFKLAPHGLDDSIVRINREGVALARAAAGPNGLIAGSIGPLGVRIEPWGPVSRDEARAAFREQAAALLDGGGVDLFMLETFYNLPELEQAVLALRELTQDVPIAALVSVTEEGTTPEGLPPAAFGSAIAEWDVDAIGVNCGVGPITTLEAIEELSDAVTLPIVAQPNAGQPRNVHGRNLYLTSPEYLASYARRFIKAGARLVGGCCGTSPEHIRAIKEAVAAVRPSVRKTPSGRVLRSQLKIEPVERSAKSSLARRFAEASFPICVRVHTPRGCDASETITQVQSLKEGGVEEISVPEVLGSGRLAPFVLAQLIQRETGHETIVEYSCRHRTLLRMQSELLGAYALGLRNVVLVTGAAPTLGEAPDATANLEVDSIGLTNMVRRLNQGQDIGGRSLGKPTAIHIGVHLDPSALDQEHELRRFRWKVDAGADFAVTPPILDVDGLAAFLPKIADCRIPILASVPLLASLRDAERLRRETGAGQIATEILERLRAAEPKGRVAEVGLEIATEIARKLRPLVDGLQIVTPAGDHARALRLTQALRKSGAEA
jgi:methionine synthase / methylenetetrahydrofolate reductase(NADPH)